jgi:hypothetical protein
MPVPEPNAVQTAEAQQVAQLYDIEPDAPAAAAPAVRAAASAGTPTAADGVAAAPPAAPVPTAIPPMLARMAEDLGIDEDTIKTSSEAELKALVSYMARELRTDREARRREQIASTGRESPPDPNLPQPAVPSRAGRDGAADPAPAAEEYTLALGEDEALFDPRLLKGIRTALSLHGKVAKLEAMVGQIGGHIQAQVNETLGERVDRLFSSLPDSHVAHFGKDKGRRDLDRDSPEMIRRMAVLQLADGMKGGSFESRFKKAVEALYGATGHSAQSPSQPTPREGRQLPPKGPDGRFVNRSEAAAVEQWNDSGLASPTDRNGGSEPQGPAKATKSVAALMRNMGDDQPTTTDEFL